MILTCAAHRTPSHISLRSMWADLKSELRSPRREAMERLLLDSQPQHAGSGRRQVAELSGLICKSPNAIDRLIALAEGPGRGSAAGPRASRYHVDNCNRRTLTGSEADEIIANTLAGFARAEERAYRADWCARRLSADCFAANYHHAGDASLPHRAHDPVKRSRKV